MKHFMLVPFTGLGLYNGFRGNHWLKNRIIVFKQFVVTSLLAQSNQYFTIWVAWRKEEKGNRQVDELYDYLVDLFGEERVVFTYAGIPFWDDKYDDEAAHQRLILSLHGSSQQLLDHIGDVDEVIMTIQPSDDCYWNGAVDEIQKILIDEDIDGVGYKHGYIANYQTKEVREYNPDTNPPFFSYKMTKSTFIDPLKHAEFTGPYKSHEYIGDHMKYRQIDRRGFLVGTHGENISTHFNIPYAGEPTELEGFPWFAIVEKANIRYSIRKKLMRSLPHKVQRKLRYWFGELLLNKITTWK